MKKEEEKISSPQGEVNEKTYTLTLTQIEALANNKEWLIAFKETAKNLPILTAKQLFKFTEPKK